MHLRSRNLPRPSASSPPGNRSHPMANPAQAPDLEGLHREIHDMAEQMRIMNENNGRLMQLLAAANPPLPAAPLVPEVERSRHSNRSGNRSRNISADQVGRGRRQAPSSSLREKSSSESSKTPTRSRRGRSPRRGDHIRARDKSTSQKIRDLDARLDAINTGIGAPVTVDTLIKQTEPPFTERILRARISSKFKLPAQLAFSATLKGPARSWFRKLSPGTIDSFGDLSRLFVANFMSCRNRQKNASHLFTIHQKENESLKEFVKRFNQAILEVEDPSDKVIIMAMMEGLRPGPLFDSLSKNVPETLSALQSKADKYIAAEELAEAKRRRRGKDDHKRKEPDTRRADYREETRYKRPDRDPKRSNNRRPRTPPRRPEFILPPLNAPVAQVLSEIKHEEFVKWPGKIKTDPQKRNRNKYCEFHRDHGHNTEDCFQLKEQIADLIKRGYLRKYITDRPPPNSPERRYGDNRPTAGNIQTIHGGFGSGGCSTSSRKKHARSAFRSVEERVYNLSSPCVGDQPPITFGSDDLRGLHLPHDDTLVISAVIANFNVQRILIDSGFGENTTQPLGWINLPITLGTEPHQTTVWQDFIVVDCPPPYNAILGRPTLGGIKAITSTYHLKMKFPTLTGIGEVKGDQKVARQCFISAMKTPEKLRIPNLSKKLSQSPFTQTSQIVKRHPGIDPEVAMHKLFTKPEYSPVRQKRRKFAPERLKVIEDEVNKLIKANVVREAHYPDWLANVVVAPKKGGKWRVCVDFTDLNKACPKDSFPLPKIDLIVDATSKHELLSFMDAFSGYHQIKMYPPDIEKTSFITERGLYCYKVMPFGLKNAGATYQRLVNKMFNAQIGKTMEVYIDDMLQLTGRVAALNRFVSKSADKCLPFFKILRKNRTFQWSEESENAFQQLKEYLGSPPLLSIPTADEDLYVYLSASPTAISAVLVREEDKIQKPIYYVSKTLIGAEVRYPRIEKIAYALMIAARKLRHYFQAHSIIVLTDQPLKADSPTTGHVGATLEMTLHNQRRLLLKRKFLKNQPREKTSPTGFLFVDGFSNQHGCGAGLVIRAPSGEQMEYAIRMGFKATNNEAEYEALLAGLRVATELGAQSLEVFSDSQLVVNQVQGDYLAKDARMIAYLGEVKAVSAKIKEFKIHQIPREDNKKADALANLASTFEFISDRFGVPKVIISDNARQFDNDRFRLFCSDLAISHHFSSPGHPQANGQVGVTNRTVLKNLKARLERSKSEWAENLPSILWAYHTTSRIPTGETPYSMVFGTESVIPVEIGMPSFRVSTFDKETNEAELRLNLDLLEERRESAELRQTAYKCQVAKYYNQRVRHRSFLPGDLVLRKVTLSTKEPNAGKLGPTWEGPYKVIKVSRPGTYWLEDLDGKALSHPWNAEHLKKYYQ
ncbi:hypothetical protein Acr_00g0068050 [Actinidia rufa]|uniref:Uncharacterized protein n=1 Tax=Actinidia rufa TaxID=165716 RepID=A0A7J0DSD2_9ERIC|nr:hypothetical protein Acr_00g0068050 [Actinidia rufa]